MKKIAKTSLDALIHIAVPSLPAKRFYNDVQSTAINIQTDKKDKTLQYFGAIQNCGIAAMDGLSSGALYGAISTMTNDINETNIGFASVAVATRLLLWVADRHYDLREEYSPMIN